MTTKEVRKGKQICKKENQKHRNYLVEIKKKCNKRSVCDFFSVYEKRRNKGKF